MKILTTAQIREADKYTIENEPVTSVDLMERAAKACFGQIRKRIKKQDKIRVFCGTGNNGGDGMAIARMLIVSGFDVSIYKINYSDRSSDDCIINENRLRKFQRVDLRNIFNKNELPVINESDIIIDAIFGTGINKPLEGLSSDTVRHINDSGAVVFSIDLPSGLFAEDNTGNIKSQIIQADYTYTFQFPKLAFMLPENDKYVGKWEVLNIGISDKFIQDIDTPYHYVEHTDLIAGFRKRSKFDHKGLFGHALLIAGSLGKAGAAVLAAKSVLRSGAGLLTTHVPKCNYVIQHTSVPEGMVTLDEDENYFSGINRMDGYSAIAVGPGLGTEKQTQNGLKLLIQNAAHPLILDADALNILAENPTWLSFIPPESILTPHVGEMDRLAGKSVNSQERLQRAMNLAFRFNCYIVLKGAHTAIITPKNEVFFNSTGNPGLAKGGSGDVLTGIILGLRAQKYSPLYSALAGVFLHGMAADLAARRKSLESLMAGEVIENIGLAVKKTFYSC